MKLKQLLLLAALVMPFTANSALMTYSGTFDTTSATLGNMVGDWSFTADFDAISNGTSVSGFTLDTFNITSDHIGILDTTNVVGGFNKSATGGLSNIFIDGTNYSGPVHPSFDDLALSYIFNGSLSYARQSIAGLGVDTGLTENSGSFSIAAPSAVPLPAAVWLFGPALLGFMGFRRKSVDTAAA